MVLMQYMEILLHMAFIVKLSGGTIQRAHIVLIQHILLQDNVT